jgi:hypothetical protein
LCCVCVPLSLFPRKNKQASTQLCKKERNHTACRDLPSTCGTKYAGSRLLPLLCASPTRQDSPRSLLLCNKMWGRGWERWSHRIRPRWPCCTWSTELCGTCLLSLFVCCVRRKYEGSSFKYQPLCQSVILGCDLIGVTIRRSRPFLKKPLKWKGNIKAAT